MALDGNDDINDVFDELEAYKHKHDPSLDDLSEEEEARLAAALATLSVDEMAATKAGEVPRAADAARRGEQLEGDTVEQENEDDSDADDVHEAGSADGLRTPPLVEKQSDGSAPLSPAASSEAAVGQEAVSRMQASKVEQKHAKQRARQAIPMRTVRNNWGGVDPLRGLVWAAAER